MLTLDEWRDIGLIAIAVGFGLLALVWLFVVLFAGRLGLRILRALRRAHDERLLGGLESAAQRQQRWRDEGALELENIPELLRSLAALRPRPKPKPKRRLWGLLPPVR